MSLTTIEFLLGPLPQVIALLAVAVVGCLFAVRRHRSEPTASLLVMAGLFAILVNAIGSYVVRIYKTQSYDKYQDAYMQGQHIAEVYALLHSIGVVGVVLIVAAVFANRAPVR